MQRTHTQHAPPTTPPHRTEPTGRSWPAITAIVVLTAAAGYLIACATIRHPLLPYPFAGWVTGAAVTVVVIAALHRRPVDRDQLARLHRLGRQINALHLEVQRLREAQQQYTAQGFPRSGEASDTFLAYLAGRTDRHQFGDDSSEIG